MMIRGPCRESTDDAAVEVHRDVQVMVRDNRSAQFTHLTAQDVVEPVEHLIGKVTRSARGLHTFEGVDGSVTAHHQMPRPGAVEFTVAERENHPVGVEVLAHRANHRENKVLGPFGGLDECSRDAVERADDAGETLLDTSKLRVVRALDRMQTDQRVQLRPVVIGSVLIGLSTLADHSASR